MSDHKPKRHTRTIRIIRGSYRGIDYELNELDEGEGWDRSQDGYAIFPQPRLKWCGYVWVDLSRINDETARKSMLPVRRDLNANHPEHGRAHWIYSSSETPWATSPFPDWCSHIDQLSSPDPNKGPFIKAGFAWSLCNQTGNDLSTEAVCCRVIDWLIEKFPELDEKEEAK